MNYITLFLRVYGGSDSKDNLIKLTSRQHYIAHLILTKVYDCLEMHRAFHIIRIKHKNHNRDFKFNSKLYESIKLKSRKLMTESMKR